MGHTPHELAADFPEYAEAISARRQSDAHFAKLADEYHALNRDVHRAETDVAPVSDDRMNEMRKQRVALKDALYAMLSEGPAGRPSRA